MAQPLNDVYSESLVVSPRRAAQKLDCGRTRLYELIANRELVTFLDGRSRKITVTSIHQYIQRRLAEQQQGAEKTHSHNPNSNKQRAGKNL